MAEQSSSDTQDYLTESQSIKPGEIIIGKLTGINNIGQPLVSYTGMLSPEPMVALTTQEISNKHIGRKAALLFANGESMLPVIVGLIHDQLSDILDNFSVDESREISDTPFPEVTKEYVTSSEVNLDNAEQVIVDGKQITIQGAEEITLRCGKASITLTKSGKILLRGTYLSNRSSGVNRILGGSVQIN